MLLELESVTMATATWRFPARVSAIAEIRAGVLAFADGRGMTEARQRDMVLAVSEAVTNVVRHAYAGDEPGDLRLDVAADDECLSVLVTDHGNGGAQSDSLGLGLRLMRAIADRFEIGPALSGPGTVVCMEFTL